ncbi:MAG: YwaF family protein [Clostridia bacterium]|nr:YwaF family protein [Clostridia bacterium]
MQGRFLRVLGTALALSLATTVSLLILEGRWQEALPLHLCSVSALCALFLALAFRQALLDFLWYLGMPGAALALLFPAPAVSRWQALLNLSYVVTHALILIIPIARMLGGAAPRGGRTGQMMLWLVLLALAAAIVNRRLGTDFLFLSAPPAATPLETVFALGYPAYLLSLFLMMLLLCLVMDRAARALHRSAVQ